MGFHSGVATAGHQHVGKQRQREVWGAGRRRLGCRKALGTLYLDDDLVAICLKVLPGRFS